MDELYKQKLVKQYISEICHYSQMQVFATSDYQKKFLQYQIDEISDEIYDLLFINRVQDINHQQTKPTAQSSQLISEQNQPTTSQTEVGSSQPITEEIEITRDMLAQNNGKDEKPSYVAVDGIVYDVSQVGLWGGGIHFGLYAGEDLTSAFMGCHQGMLEILQKLPKVGKLKQD